MLSLRSHARSRGIGLLFSVSLAGPTKVVADDLASPVRVRDGLAAAAVRRALPQVQRRLADPECRRVFTDFTTAMGKPLQAILEERGQEPADYLGAILFYDGSASAGCAGTNVLAITSPGSLVVFLCVPRLLKVRNRKEIEALIIHEMLHTLGLGEDPPSTGEITARVAMRCGL